MKNFIIKLLGGITNKEFIELNLSKENLRKESFRKGDEVYILENPWISIDPFQKQFLLESYNGINNWYFSSNPNDPKRREMINGISVQHISKTKPCRCPTCGQSIKKIGEAENLKE